jgi:hypothetical protein
LSPDTRHYPIQSVVRPPYRLSTALSRYVARVNEPNCLLCELHPHHILQRLPDNFSPLPIGDESYRFLQSYLLILRCPTSLCFSTLVGLHIVSATIRCLVNDVMKCRLATNAEYTGERPKFEFHLLFYVIARLYCIHLAHHSLRSSCGVLLAAFKSYCPLVVPDYVDISSKLLVSFRSCSFID